MALKSRITYPKGMSPRGSAVFPHTTKPDTKFKDEGEFKTDLDVPEADAADVIAAVDEMMEKIKNGDEKIIDLLGPTMRQTYEKAAKAKKLKPADVPYRAATDRDGDAIDGVIRLRFKSVAQYTKKDGEVVKGVIPHADRTGKIINKKDAKGRLLPADLDLWGGSIIKVAFSMKPWANPKGEYGVKLNMDAIQVIELRSGGERDYGFGAEDGAYEIGEDDDSGTDSAARGSTETSEDDNGGDF
jgi:hypothetical protein